MDQNLVKRYHFFKEHAGWIVGEKARCALDLARAEIAASERSWCFCWTEDTDADWPFVETWPEKEQACFWESNHFAYGCVLKDFSGEVLASLWGITDPDETYMQVIEAELASEALYEEREAIAICH